MLLVFIVVVIPGHNLGISQVNINRTIGPTLVIIVIIILILVFSLPAFCICNNKSADQLHSDCVADQRKYFAKTTTIHLLLNPRLKPLAIFFACTARFVSGLVGNT